MVFMIWFSGLGISTLGLLGYDFQDMVFRTWDLNFGAWISHRGKFPRPKPENF